MNSVVRASLVCIAVILQAPVNSTSRADTERPQLRMARGTGSNVEISFPTRAGLRYQVVSSTDLIFWEPASDLVTGQNDVVTFSYDVSSARNRFFKVLVKAIPPQVAVTVQSPGNGAFAMSFPTQASRQYQVYASRNLVDWMIWGDLLVGDGSALTVRPSTQEAAVLFFRVDAVEIVPAPNMVRIPAGRFVMGSPLTEQDRDLDEDPLTTVEFIHGFWMGKFEVTQKEFEAVMGTNPSSFRGDVNRPVEQVTWKEAMAYCARLTDNERAAGRLPFEYAYRLPTEAEFEYAARGGSTTRFSFGDDVDYSKLGEYAWYDANSEKMTHPVGQKKPNAFGLYDIAGNVWEWCFDWYSSSYPGGTVAHPVGPELGLAHVFRGGGWDYKAAACRAAFRNYVTPTRRLDYLGFRIVLAPVM